MTTYESRDKDPDYHYLHSISQVLDHLQPPLQMHAMVFLSGVRSESGKRVQEVATMKAGAMQSEKLNLY